MALRIVEIVLPGEDGKLVESTLEGIALHGLWHRELADGRAMISVLIEGNVAEEVLDRLDKRFIWGDRARLVLIDVEATRPKIEPQEPLAGSDPAGQPPTIIPDRISRDELMMALDAGTRTTPVYLFTVLLSSLIASIGLMRNDVAVLIGAMVIAPLLTPNMALALGTTLGDLKLIKSALRTNIAGVSLALGYALMFGLLTPVASDNPAFVARTEVGLGDIVLGLSAGTAGALAFTSGVPAGLVGVMVAVALLPPTVVTGTYIGQGETVLAAHAFLLLACNVICVNLSATLTFLLKGIRPRAWWEAGRARRATRLAVIFWGLLLAALVVVILLASPRS